MPNLEQMKKRQQVLADFGEFTLCSENSTRCSTKRAGS